MLLEFNYGTGPAMVVPPGGYVYIHAEDGHVDQHGVFLELEKLVIKHKQANGYEIPGNLRELMMDQDCQRKPPGFCREAVTRAPYHPLHTAPITIDDVIAGTKTWAHHQFDRSNRPDESEIQRRLAICAGCQYNTPFESGCHTCSGSKVLHTIINAVTVGKKFKDDQKMRACYFCKCSNSAQARVRLDILQGQMLPGINERLPDWCWKKKG